MEMKEKVKTLRLSLLPHISKATSIFIGYKDVPVLLLRLKVLF